MDAKSMREIAKLAAAKSLELFKEAAARDIEREAEQGGTITQLCVEKLHREPAIKWLESKGFKVASVKDCGSGPCFLFVRWD